MSLFRKTPSFLAEDAELNAIERVYYRDWESAAFHPRPYPTSKSVARKKKSQFWLN